MDAVDAFVRAVDAALMAQCVDIRPDGRVDGGGITTRYYAAGGRRAAVWFQCESFGGEISATVCGGDDVFTDVGKLANCLAGEASK